MKKLRIGNSSGFWGDEPMAMYRQVRAGNLDYLTADYLAEVSMSILAKQQVKNPEAGYVSDFIDHVELSMDALRNHFPKIITNAGGNNPVGCAKRLQSLLNAHGIQKKVLAVTGDNLMPHISELRKKGNSFENIETNQTFDHIQLQLKSANVYTSAEGIERALDLGADIVICGRASDSALVIGPIKHEMKWDANQWDLIGSAMVAGHILECGAQSTGGNFTDWDRISNWEDIGYPIIEIFEDGTFQVTKPKGSGGLVNEWTVKEQLVYEIGNPGQYMGPDVITDLTTLSVVEDVSGVVTVSGVRGLPAPNTWKVSMAFHDGFKASGMIVVGGEQAFQKAQLVRDIFWKRLPAFKKVRTNFIGADALGKSLSQPNSREILLQFIAFDDDRKKLESFAKEVAGLILSGPQGLAAFGGRPRIQEVMAFWPALVNKSQLELSIWNVDGKGKGKVLSTFIPAAYKESHSSVKARPYSSESISISEKSEMIEVPLSRLCLARSGDKGNSINLGVLARTKEIYAFIHQQLTSNQIKEWFSDFCYGTVQRYELANLLALNFVLNDALDGGGTRSGRLDPQGKMVASSFLARKILVPKDVVTSIGL